MKNDLINFKIRLSEVQIIETALSTLEAEAIKIFNKEDFSSMEDIFERTEKFKELHTLKKCFRALILMKMKELQNEKI